MEPDQVDVPAGAVPGGFHQRLEAWKAGLARQQRGHVLQPDGFDRIDDDVAVVHRVAAAGFDVRMGPDAHAAADPPAPHALTQLFSKEHRSGLIWFPSQPLTDAVHEKLDAAAAWTDVDVEALAF